MPKWRSVRILLAVVIVLVGAARFKPSHDPKSLDAQRMKDMRALAGALDAYYRDHNEYPPTPVGIDCWPNFNTAIGLDTALIPKYISRIPKDPRPETCENNYQYASDRTNYVLLAHLDTLATGNHWCVAATAGYSAQTQNLPPCP
jgi:hypothetical protein